ncbi:MAG: major capsid protein [Gemmatimonadaceae bacterium]
MDLFSTHTLIGVVQGLKSPPSALLDRYFGTIVQDTAEEIHFDVISTKRRIAPFVSPLVEGKIVEGLGHTVKTFQPAYIKDKRVFDSNRPFKRAIGEQIGGSLSPQERLQAHIAYELQDQTDMVTRRLEVMASEAIRTGKVTVVGDGYPEQVVDFGRAAGHTVTALSGAAMWDETTSTPLDDLQAWHDLALQESGAPVPDVIMGMTAWKWFRKHADVKDRLDVRRALGSELDLGAQLTEGMMYRGVIDGFNIFTYAGWYVDPATGSETAIWPADVVALTSAMLEGVRAFGAIRDEEADLQALPFFPKSWLNKDPAVRYLMMQSAPLVVPTRVNASVAVDVV